jgi:hypothetical protein
MKLSVIVGFSLACVGAASAATIVTFGGGTDSSYTLQQFGGLPAPTVLTNGGNPGGYLRLTANINDQHNFVPVDQTDPGLFPVSTFSFQFRIDLLGGGGADGLSFSYLDTALYGVSGGIGAPLFTAEDPGNAGVLGFGFDTYGNGGANDANLNGPDYSEISLFLNGTLVSRIDDTRVLPTPFNLKDPAVPSPWHTAKGTVDFQNAKVSLSVDDIPVFDNIDVPGLVPFDSRVMFAARTGGANERASIDNLNVQYLPEPGTFSLLGLGASGMFWRRRAWASPA